MGNNIKLYIVIAKLYDQVFYVLDTDPFLWTVDILNSKFYHSYEEAENDILRNYNNYHTIKKLLKSSQIDSMFVLEIQNHNEVGRVQII